MNTRWGDNEPSLQSQRRSDDESFSTQIENPQVTELRTPDGEIINRRTALGTAESVDVDRHRIDISTVEIPGSFSGSFILGRGPSWRNSGFLSGSIPGSSILEGD